MGQGSTGIERARRDLAEGRPWKARQRIGSYLGAHPADQEALDLLGEICAAMNDLPAAGAAWFLTARDDERAREAVAVLRDEHRGSLTGLIGALPLRLAADDPGWPPEVSAQLRELAAEAGRQGLSMPSRRPPPPAAGEWAPEGSRGDVVVLALVALVLALLVGCTLLGLVVAVRWLVGLV